MSLRCVAADSIYANNANRKFSMQYVLRAFNMLIINMVLCAKIASGDKQGTKICRPKEKKSKYEIQFCTLQNKPMHGVFGLDLLLTRVAK